MAIIPLPPVSHQWIDKSGKPTQAFGTAMALIEAQIVRSPMLGVPFANLPPAVAGMIAYVTDSNTAVWGAAIAGGGANKVLAFYNGAAWKVFAA